MQRILERSVVYLVSFGLTLGASTALANIAGGIDWLNSEAAADGSINSPVSPATPFQSTAESLLAFSAAGQPIQPTSGLAVQFLIEETFNNPENLSRKITAGSLYGVDVTLLAAELIASQNADGGFGGSAGFESTALDTGLALDALAPGLPASSRGLDFLLVRQNADGGFPLVAGGESSGYVTAIAIDALQRLQTVTDVSLPIERAVTFLLSCQLATGGFGSDWENALALRALIPAEPNSTLWIDVVNELRAAQRANGSWSDDAYATALAIQALVLADQTAVIVIPDTGSITGRVINTGNGLPVVGAGIAINGVVDTAQQSNIDGVIRAAGITPGNATIEISANGFQTATIFQQIIANEVANLGDIGLTPTAGSAFVFGRVTDASTGLGVSGATVTVEPDVGVSQSATTNALGEYSIVLEPSAFAVSIEAPAMTRRQRPAQSLLANTSISGCRLCRRVCQPAPSLKLSAGSSTLSRCSPYRVQASGSTAPRRT